MRTKDGLVSFYGTNPAPSAHPQYPVAPVGDPAVTSRPDRAADIFEWRLTLTLDPFGNRIEYLYDVVLNAPFLKPRRNMDQQIVDKAPHRWKHTPQRRVNQVENIFRARPFGQDSLDKARF